MSTESSIAPSGGLGKSLVLFELQFLHPKNTYDGNIFLTDSTMVLIRSAKMIYVKVKSKT